MPASVVVFRSTVNSRFDGRELGDRLAPARDFEQPHALPVVRPLARSDAVEDKMVAGDVDGPAGRHRHDALLAPRRGGDDADHREPEAGMRERGAIGRARQIAEPAPRLGPARPRTASCDRRSPTARRRSATRRGRCPKAQATGPRCVKAKTATAASSANAGRRGKTLCRRERIAPLPGEQRPERHHQQQRHDQRHEGGVEERRSDRDLVAASGDSSASG